MRTFEPSPYHVTQELIAHQKYRADLLAEIPDLDDETLADTLEGLTDLKEMITMVIRSALVDQALAQGLKGRIEEMKARQARFEERVSKKRALALKAMTEGAIAKIAVADFTASLRAGGPKLEIIDEAKVPGRFFIPQPAKLDKRALLAALRSGAVIDGATTVTGHQQLSLRTK
jgi:Siphovirus Gp157